MPSRILGAYTASKHTVKGFTDSLRLMHDRAPVSVTLINLSGIHTPFGEHSKDQLYHCASKVPPPVYAPQLVADAIRHAAQHTDDLLWSADPGG
jgi:short-subunit dehydrogenase